MAYIRLKRTMVITSVKINLLGTLVGIKPKTLKTYMDLRNVKAVGKVSVFFWFLQNDG